MTTATKNDVRLLNHVSLTMEIAIVYFRGKLKTRTEKHSPKRHYYQPQTNKVHTIKRLDNNIISTKT